MQEIAFEVEQVNLWDDDQEKTFWLWHLLCLFQCSQSCCALHYRNCIARI